MDQENDLGFDPKMLQTLMSGMGGKGGKMPDPMQMAKLFITSNNPQMVEQSLNNIDLLKFGPDLMVHACTSGAEKSVQLLIEKGVDFKASPPEYVADLEKYRKQPYIFQAISSGKRPCIETVLQKTSNLDEEGFVCFSRKRKNLVKTNVIGACAYHGLQDVMKQFLKDKLSGLNTKATEAVDMFGLNKNKPLVKDWVGYTPLMLAVAGSDKNLDCIKLLLKNKAAFDVKDEAGNTLLHIAAYAGNNEILEYLGKSLDIEIFDRNTAGETALSICTKLKNKSGENILGQLQGEYDKSNDATMSLFDDLIAEEEKAKAEKAKKKAKRERNKVNQLAKAQNKTAAEVEEELRVAAEKKAKEEEEQRKKEIEAEAEADRLAKIERQKKHTETKRLKEELARMNQQEQIEKARLEMEERRRQQQLQREQEAERQRVAKERAEKRRAMRSVPRNENREEYASERPRKADVTEKKERVKSNVRRDQTTKVDPEDEFVTPAPVEEVKAPETERPKPQDARDKREQMQRRSSKSVRRVRETPGEESTLLGENKTDQVEIFGLGGELAAKTAGRHTKKKLAQLRKEEEEEEKRTKERMKQLAAERAQKKIDDVEKAKEEERKKVEEAKKEKQREKDKRRRERKAAEKAAADAAAAEAEVKEEVKEEIKEAAKKPKANTKTEKKKQAQDEKDGAESTATAPKKSARRTKPEKANDGENVPPVDSAPKTEVADEAQPKSEKRGRKEKPKMVYQAKHGKGPADGEKPQEETKDAKKPESKKVLAETSKTDEVKKVLAKEPDMQVEAPVVVTPKAEEPVEKEPAATKASKKEKKEKSAAKKAEPAEKVEKKAPGAKPSHDVGSLKQMVLAKDSEIMKLEIHLERKDSKIDSQAKEIAALKKQLADNAKGDSLKEQVAALNQNLMKHKALTKLQATQIVEFEDALWTANKAKEEAEDKLLGAPEGPSVEDANRDLRAKNFQMRDLQKSLDKYQGKAKALAFLSKGDLSQLQDELAATLANIATAMEEK